MNAEAPRERSMQSKDRGRDWSEVPTSQGAPRSSWDHQTLREAGGGKGPDENSRRTLRELSEGAPPSLTAPAPTSGLQSWETMNVCRAQPRGL